MGGPKNQQEKLNEIFYPHLLGKIKSLREGQFNLVHYTSAETALKILRSKKVWMRNSNEMADYTEIKTGTRAIKAYFDPIEGNAQFWNNIDQIRPGIKEQIHSSYNFWVPEIEKNTHLFCISEHEKTEDKFGKLSMWRGFGGRSGVAIVFKSAPFLSERLTLGAASYPVIYSNYEEKFKAVTKSISQNFDFLRQIEGDVISGYFILMFLSFAFCLKHPAFSEEREWRVVFLPSFFQIIRDASPLKGIPLPIKPSTELINNKPQTVYNIPLEKILGKSEKDSFDIRPKNIIERIIIGPCKNPSDIQDVFINELQENGAEDPKKKVHISGIPLRG